MDLSFTVKDAAGNAFDLTGYTITFKMWRKGIPGTLVVSGTGAIVNATAGTCKYTVASGDFNTVGLYSAEVELTKTGVVQSVEVFDLEVKESG